MSDVEARNYGRYARHLFEMSREGNMGAALVLLESMEADELRMLCAYFVQAGGVLTSEQQH